MRWRSVWLCALAGAAFFVLPSVAVMQPHAQLLVQRAIERILGVSPRTTPEAFASRCASTHGTFTRRAEPLERLKLSCAESATEVVSVEFCDGRAQYLTRVRHVPGTELPDVTAEAHIITELTGVPPAVPRRARDALQMREWRTDAYACTLQPIVGDGSESALIMWTCTMRGAEQCTTHP